MENFKGIEHACFTCSSGHLGARAAWLSTILNQAVLTTSMPTFNGIYTSGPITRTAAGTGYLSGNYNVGETWQTSGAIYSIGNGYAPGTTSLGNMYGIGYGYSGQAGINVPGLSANNWGMYVASNGTPRIFLNADSGNINLAGDIYWGKNSIWLSQWLNQAVLTTSSPTFQEVYANGWFRSNGQQGWYNSTYGGGIYMTDSTWVRTYNNKSFYAGGDIQSGGVFYPSNGAGGYLYGDGNGIHTNGNFLSNADIYLGAMGNWLSTLFNNMQSQINTLYSWINQPVTTTSSPTFSDIYLTGLGWIKGLIPNQNVNTNSSPTFNNPTINALGGPLTNLLNQDVRSMAAPMFAGMTITGGLNVSGQTTVGASGIKFADGSVQTSAYAAANTIINGNFNVNTDYSIPFISSKPILLYIQYHYCPVNFDCTAVTI